MDNTDFQNAQLERQTPASGRKQGRRDGAPLFVVIPLFIVLFIIYGIGAVSVNRLYKQIDRLESAAVQTQRDLADISNETERIKTDLAVETDEEVLENPSVNYDMVVKTVAHRGLSAIAPENTLPAFALAKQNGFSYVETDIQFTADGYAVCLHDNTIDRTSNGSGEISSMTLEEVRQYDFGSWKSGDYAGTTIPTFEEFLTLCRSLGLHPYIELKAADASTEARIRDLVETVKAFGMDGKVTWISFSYQLLAYVKYYSPTARLGYLVTEINFDTITSAQWLKSPTNTVFLDSRSYSDAECQLCVSNDIPLEVWTIDSTDAIVSMNPYVSGITSNSLIAGKVLSEAYLDRNGTSAALSG